MGHRDGGSRLKDLEPVIFMSCLIYAKTLATDVSRWNIVYGQLVALFFLALGLVALVFPYQVQAAALRKPKKFWGFPNPFLGFIETQGYIWMLRISGIVFTAAGMFIELVILGS